MTSGTSTRGVTTYKPLPRPKQQQIFPNRRRSVRPRTRAPLANISREQSTLTQLDFVSTPRTDSDVINVSSDEEFEESRPKKRQRTTKSSVKERGQTTLTQMVDTPGPRHTEEIDEDGFQIWDDYDQERIPETAAEQHDEEPRDMPWLRRTADDNVENEHEIPEISRSEAPPSPLNKITAKPRAIVNVCAPKTPTKTRRKEIPSSQTPSSAGLSSVNSARAQVEQHSPLKEKSNNVPLLASNPRSSESRDTSMKSASRVRQDTRKVRLNDSPTYEASSQHSGYARKDKANLKQSPQRRPRTLQRVTTLQDSQAQELDLDHVTVVAESPIIVKSTPKFRRVTTVQDSQYDPTIILSDDARNDDDDFDDFDDFDEHEQQQSYSGFTQATFDPVNSALDRDAARFGWTQTQAGIPSEANERYEDNETDDEDDLDRGCGTWQHEKIGVGFVQANDKTVDPFEVKAVVNARIGDEDPNDSGNVAVVRNELVPSSPPIQYPEPSKVHFDKAVAERVVLSSSPSRRPSQVNTVVPTQASLNSECPNSNDLVEQSLPHTFLSEASTIPAREPSPRKPRMNLQHAPFSSPIPLPPWSSPYREPLDRHPTDAAVVVKDWSLPPPPPMSSSTAGTPASSSK